uniref:EGF-like domain-containing protein n=1 Tax=Timema bartmani TaxID=61472 RepID=A0A7R9F084_9NEOP|nr:unnamed protein product [Timema bartmani]
MNLCVVPEREWGSSRGNLAPSEAIRASSRTCLPIEDGEKGGNTVAARDGLTPPANITLSRLLGPNQMRKTTNICPSFWCTCPIGYSASLCEIPVANSCDSDPCLNGGTCALISLDKYTCTCSPGYTGQHCELQDHCASNPCRNGADCTSSGDSYKCKCSPGFIGPTCSEDIVECRSAPCVHGRCFNTHGSYKILVRISPRAPSFPRSTYSAGQVILAGATKASEISETTLGSKTKIFSSASGSILKRIGNTASLFKKGKKGGPWMPVRCELVNMEEAEQGEQSLRVLVRFPAQACFRGQEG